MRSIVFEGDTWKRYEDLRRKDKVLHKNLCKIIQYLQRHDPMTGLGKPEMLRENLTGLWSRRLSKKDRLVYNFSDEAIHIFAIGGHYDKC